MFDTICTLPLPADIFTLALHPNQSIFSLGLSSGHVRTYRLPSESSPSPEPSLSDTSANGSHALANAAAPRRSSLTRPFRHPSGASSNGLGAVNTLWSTRRHKGSCRAIKYAADGTSCYSAGADGIVKKFDVETGRVTGKYVMSTNDEGRVDAPTVLEVVGEYGLLVGSDAGSLELRDLRDGSGSGSVNGTAAGKKSLAGTWTPHATEHINSLVLLPASESSTSGVPKSCISVGGTTLAVTDFRKGVVSVSEDQDVELTSLALVDGLAKTGTSVGQKVLVGQADGVLGLFERGIWGDIDDRIIVDKLGASIDALVEVPLDMLAMGRGKDKVNEKIVAVGLDDGRVRFVRIGRNAVLHEFDVKHDDVEGVVGLGFDIEGRMVSAGGEVAKVWCESKGTSGGGRGAMGEGGGIIIGKRKFDLRDDEDNFTDEDGEDEDGDDDGDDDEEIGIIDERNEDVHNNTNCPENDSENDEDSDSDSDQEPQQQSKRKKRKRNKGKDKSGGTVLNFKF